MIQARVDFDKNVRPWDGFGVNYVETCQTRDPHANPQDYGGFSTLTPGKQEEILDLIFGEEGILPGIVKMFLDPFHQKSVSSDINSLHIHDDDYDHLLTTRWMREFVAAGLSRYRSQSRPLTVMTGLYGPPAFMTAQRVVRGRDLDPAMKIECAKYICAFAKFLREKEGVPVSAVSIHNEGEGWPRWPENGGDTGEFAHHDYNMYWPPELVAEMIPLVRAVLDDNGMKDVAVAPGETYSWPRFHQWGYADAIADSEAARRDIGLVTSHGFAFMGRRRWHGDFRSAGIDMIREHVPDCHAWVTSCSFDKMDAEFVWEMAQHIYSTKVNGIIPWACIQNPTLWEGKDPNPGCCFTVDGNGNYTVLPGYHLLKMVSRAGQRGSMVARTRCNDMRIGAMAFSAVGKNQEDNLVLVNNDPEEGFDVALTVGGARSDLFHAVQIERQEPASTLSDPVRPGVPYTLHLPPKSATAFYGGPVS